MEKKISVAMATYCGEKYIRKQLLSIIEQSVSVDEIIICDDCSHDATVLEIKKIADEYDLPIKLYINDTNLGYKRNFRKAISLTCGEIIFLADQDDIWEKDKVKKIVELIEKKRGMCVCTGIRLIDGYDNYIQNFAKLRKSMIKGYDMNWDNEINKISLERLVWGNFSPGCTYAFTKKVKEIYLKLNNDIISHDYQLLMIGANYNKAYYYNAPLTNYRIHEFNTIGFYKKIVHSKVSLKPKLVYFLDDLNEICNVKKLCKLKIILYMRLPYLRKKIKFNC